MATDLRTDIRDRLDDLLTKSAPAFAKPYFVSIDTLADAVMDAIEQHNAPEPSLPAIINEEGEVACPECGGTIFGYVEGCQDYRHPGGQDAAAKTVSVVWTMDGTAESGDSVPGLICDNYRGGGCGKPIELPDGWTIRYD